MQTTQGVHFIIVLTQLICRTSSYPALTVLHYVTVFYIDTFWSLRIIFIDSHRTQLAEDFSLLNCNAQEEGTAMFCVTALKYGVGCAC